MMERDVIIYPFGNGLIRLGVVCTAALVGALGVLYLGATVILGI